MKRKDFGLPRRERQILQRIAFFSGFAIIFLIVLSSYTPPPSIAPLLRLHSSVPLIFSSSSSPASSPTILAHRPPQAKSHTSSTSFPPPPLIFPPPISPPRLPPPPSPPPSPPPPSSPPSLSSRAVSKPWCDLSKGEWVPNPEGPYYTNLTCSVIQEHQNCMKYGRPDLGFLKWRWKPDGCELPLFDPAQFLRLLRGRAMAFIGDSLARNQMQSLMCLLSRVENPVDVSKTTDLNFRRMHYERHNFTLSIFWSPFLVRSETGHLPGLNWTGLWNLYLDEPDPAWTTQISEFDFVIISGGNWFTRPSVFYEKRRVVGSSYYLLQSIKVLSPEYANWKGFRTAFDAINRAGQEGRFRGEVFLRSLSPSHFESGQWNSGGDCVRTQPFRRNETKAIMPLEGIMYRQQKLEFRRAKVEAKKRKKGVRFRVMDATAAMLLRPDGHPSRYGHRQDPNVVFPNDCVHWCLPGPVAPVKGEGREERTDGGHGLEGGEGEDAAAIFGADCMLWPDLSDDLIDAIV